MNSSLLNSIKTQAANFAIEWQAIAAFVAVETGGLGFDASTEKIIIQFEPSWFRKKAPYTPSGKWSLNGVERQTAEWVAFNDAFARNPDAAMQATSIGLGQIMGFHYKRLGYASVGEMWDDAKKGIDRQIWQICKFISTDTRLLNALKSKNWHLVSVYYNGSGYRELAKKYGRVPYNISMRNEYAKLKKL